MAASRERLPDVRRGITHKFTIKYQSEEGSMKELEGFLIANRYEDGRLGELFITVDKEGSVVAGLCDTIGMLISIALQSGVPLEKLCEKLVHTRFNPTGFTYNKDIPIAKSIMDYIGEWLGQTFLGWPSRSASYEVETMPKEKPEEKTPKTVTISDAPFCDTCGKQMIPCGACYKCDNCGSTSGCG